MWKGFKCHLYCALVDWYWLFLDFHDDFGAEQNLTSLSHLFCLLYNVFMTSGCKFYCLLAHPPTHGLLKTRFKRSQHHCRAEMMPLMHNHTSVTWDYCVADSREMTRWHLHQWASIFSGSFLCLKQITRYSMSSNYIRRKKNVDTCGEGSGSKVEASFEWTIQVGIRVGIFRRSHLQWLWVTTKKMTNVAMWRMKEGAEERRSNLAQ